MNKYIFKIILLRKIACFLDCEESNDRTNSAEHNVPETDSGEEEEFIDGTFDAVSQRTDEGLQE